MISRIELNLRYSDTDQMGVIYHANYFTYFEQGRTAYLRELGYMYHEIEEAGLLFPVRDVNCTYLKSIRFGDTVYLNTYVKDVSKIKITYGHELYNSSGDLCAKGQTSVVSVAKEDFSLSRFDQTYPKLYKKYKENIV